MKLNRQTDIAISALVYGVRSKGRLFCIDAIAKNCGISTASVAQVTRRLTRLGWFESHRGRGGGLTLAMDAERLSLAHIVDTLQPARRDRAPPLRPIDLLLCQAEQSRLASLDRYTLRDLADDKFAVPYRGRIRETTEPTTLALSNHRWSHHHDARSMHETAADPAVLHHVRSRSGAASDPRGRIAGQSRGQD
jgi:DNA-binding IscR family transcriptional regulator